MIERAAIYTRVSTTEQTKGYSLSSQEKDCLEYAQRNNLDVIKIFHDDISGATQLDERDGGARLLQLVNHSRIDAVIVWRLDRLSRPPEDEYSRLLTTIEHFSRKGVTVHDCETGAVKSDMSSIMIAFFKGLAASQERAAIRKRTMRGIKAKAQAGKWIGQGDPPYGFRKIGKGRDAYLQIHQERAAIVRRIFDLYIGQHGKSLTIKQIATLLTHENVPTPGQAKKGGRKGRGGWYVATISKKILTNKNYLGIFEVQGITLEFPDLAIVDEATWEMAQERKLKNKRNAKRNQKRQYLLSGRLSCICDGSLVGESKKRRQGGYHIYYRCQKRRYDHIEKCEIGYVRADVIETAVWEWLTQLLNDPQALDDGLKHMAKTANEETESTLDRLETVDGLLVKAKRDIMRFMTAFGNVDDDTVAEALQAQVLEKTRVKTSLERERTELKSKLAHAEFTPELRDEIIAMATKIATLLPHGSYEKKRHLLDVIDFRARLMKRDDEGLNLQLTCRLAPNPFLIEFFDRRFKSGRPDRWLKRPFLHRNGRFLFA